MLLGGDWKQLLPVVRSTYGRGVLNYTIKNSPLWSSFKTLYLTKNMRVEAGAEEFASFLDCVGRADREVQNGECK